MKPKYSRILRNLTCGSLLIAWSQLGAASKTWNDPAANNTWDTTATDTWADATAWNNATPDSAIFVGTGETITLGVPITANTLSFNSADYLITGNTLTLSGVSATIDATQNATIDSALAGDAFTKAGAATLTLNGSVAGGITVAAGTVVLGGNFTRSLGVPPAWPDVSGSLKPGTTLLIKEGSVAAPSGAVAGAVQIDAGATLRNSAAHMFQTATARVWINGGTLTSGTDFSYPEYYLPGGASAADPGVQFTGGTITGDQKRWSLGDNFVRVNAADATALFTSHVNQYAAGGQSRVYFDIIGGTVPDGVDFLCSGNMGDAGWGGTINYVKTGAGLMEMTGQPILAGNGTFTLTEGTLRLTGASAITNFGGTGVALDTTNPATLQLNAVSATDILTFSKTLSGGSAAATVAKIGAGTVTLSGATTYAGATTINEGTFNLTGALGDTAVSVAGGATLSGEGSIGTSGSLTFDEGATLRIDGSTATALTVGTTTTGNVTLNGTTTVQVDNVPPSTGANTYRVLDYFGTLTGGAHFVAPGYRATFDTTTPNQVNFTVGTYALIWTGNAGAAWDLGTTASWVSTGPDSFFHNGDSVIFGDGPALRDLTLDGTVRPAAVDFTNTAGNDYSLTGTGTIAGGAVLTKSGNGKVTLATANTHTGATTLTAGILEVGGTDALGTSGVISMNGGTLRYTDSNNSDYSARLRLEDGKSAVVDTNGREVTFATPLATGGAGTGALAKTGLGTLTLTPNNTFSGGTTISAGTLRLDGGFDGYCAGTGPITLGDGNTPTEGASLGVFGANWSTGPDRWVANDVTVAATGAGSGPLMIFRPTGIYAATLRGTLTLANSVILRNTTGDRLAIEGKITGTGNLTIEGNRVNIDNAANDYIGSTTIAAGGILQMNNNNVIPANSEVTVNGQMSFHSDIATALTIKALNGSGAVNILVGTGNPVLTVGANDGDGSFSGAINSRLALIKTGTGTQILSGSGNDYSGDTKVELGTLQIDGAKTGAGAVTVQAAATLAGSGSVNGTTTIEAGGFVAPGNATIGTLRLASATIGGTYQCQLDAASGDLLALTGTLTVDAGTSISFSGTPAANEYTIVTYGSLSGTLPTIVAPIGYAVDTATTGQIKLIKTASNYAAWADGFAGLTDKTPGGDADTDGIKNLVEYVIGGDPRVSSTEYLPKQSISGGNLVLSYHRSDASEADTTQTGQWSTNLSGWSDLAPVLINENGTDPDDMVIRIPLSNAVNGALFGRLKVSQTP